MYFLIDANKTKDAFLFNDDDKDNFLKDVDQYVKLYHDPKTENLRVLNLERDKATIYDLNKQDNGYELVKMN